MRLRPCCARPGVSAVRHGGAPGRTYGPTLHRLSIAPRDHESNATKELLVCADVALARI